MQKFAVIKRCQSLPSPLWPSSASPQATGYSNGARTSMQKNWPRNMMKEHKISTYHFLRGIGGEIQPVDAGVSNRERLNSFIPDIRKAYRTDTYKDRNDSIRLRWED
jgi:hypothetical protein